MTEAADAIFSITITLLAIFVPVIALTAGYEWIVKNRSEWLKPKPPVPPRLNHRIPASERALLGDDYRKLVAPYFARKRALQEKQRQEQS